MAPDGPGFFASAPLKLRANQDWSSGLVADKTRKGIPIRPLSNKKTLTTGCAVDDDRGVLRTQPGRHPVRQQITAQQSCLKKYQAGGPDRGRAAQQRKKFLAGDGLNEKQQKASQENGDRI